jgi:hypothetical protein
MHHNWVSGSCNQMQTWSITLYGSSGIISTVDTSESQFVIGTETANDVFTIHGDGVMPRHAWVWISEAGLQVEDLGGGTLVNGYHINERVQMIGIRFCPVSAARARGIVAGRAKTFPSTRPPKISSSNSPPTPPRSSCRSTAITAMPAGTKAAFRKGRAILRPTRSASRTG